MKTLFTCLFLSLLSGCGSTKLVEHWQDESFSRDQFNNVLIVAATINNTNRFLFEKSIKSSMDEEGLNGLVSMEVIGDAFPTKEMVQKYISNHPVDYIMATKMSNMKVEKDYVPPSIRTYYTGPYYPSYGHYYNDNSTVTLTRDAYVDTKTTAVLVTTIFDAKTQKPVWIGRTEAFEAHSANKLATTMARSFWKNVNR
ncbi:MAG: hypothetical protein ACJAWK_001512 [Candidatus Azotimanducaceae bacterium]|jgi:hypothetical protein